MSERRPFALLTVRNHHLDRCFGQFRPVGRQQKMREHGYLLKVWKHTPLACAALGFAGGTARRQFSNSQFASKVLSCSE
jgi:hypothetical protein